MQEAKESSSYPAANGIFGVRIDDLLRADLDALPFGVIRLDRSGFVVGYNAYEERHARRDRERVIGRSFFHEVAPCTNVAEFYGRFIAGVHERHLDTTFGFVFPFAHGDRHVFVTLFYQAADDAIWVIIRDSGRMGR